MLKGTWLLPPWVFQKVSPQPSGTKRSSPSRRAGSCHRCGSSSPSSRRPRSSGRAAARRGRLRLRWPRQRARGTRCGQCCAARPATARREPRAARASVARSRAARRRRGRWRRPSTTRSSARSRWPAPCGLRAGARRCRRSRGRRRARAGARERRARGRAQPAQRRGRAPPSASAGSPRASRLLRRWQQAQEQLAAPLRARQPARRRPTVPKAIGCSVAKPCDGSASRRGPAG